MKIKVAVEIDCDGKYCGQCQHKFKGRSSTGMCWVCNLFRTEKDDGHTGTCLNSKDNMPIRCKECQDNEVKMKISEKIKKLIDEKNGYIIAQNNLKAWRDDVIKGDGVFIAGNIDDLENNIQYYDQEIEKINTELDKWLS